MVLLLFCGIQYGFLWVLFLAICHKPSTTKFGLYGVPDLPGSYSVSDSLWADRRCIGHYRITPKSSSSSSPAVGRTAGWLLKSSWVMNFILSHFNKMFFFLLSSIDTYTKLNGKDTTIIVEVGWFNVYIYCMLGSDVQPIYYQYMSICSLHCWSVSKRSLIGKWQSVW